MFAITKNNGKYTWFQNLHMALFTSFYRNTHLLMLIVKVLNMVKVFNSML